MIPTPTPEHLAHVRSLILRKVLYPSSKSNWRLVALIGMKPLNGEYFREIWKDALHDPAQRNETRRQRR